ncbi:hypothetical protein SLS60_008739 [Paraconiothyrium brasiliense]|uniref:Uncharacterized protein n=1 Tax=Paraconiothyrium brasiliense TaxID=300254 RepID=A0ABR3QYD4_9PLEO
MAPSFNFGQAMAAAFEFGGSSFASFEFTTITPAKSADKIPAIKETGDECLSTRSSKSPGKLASSLYSHTSPPRSQSSLDPLTHRICSPASIGTIANDGVSGLPSKGSVPIEPFSQTQVEQWVRDEFRIRYFDAVENLQTYGNFFTFKLGLETRFPEYTEIINNTLAR